MTLDIQMPDGTRGLVEVLHLSPRGTFAAVKLAGTPHKGTVDVFHTGTGLRVTPTRHFDKVRARTIAAALADDLDAYDPVADDGTLRVDRAEYHRHVDGFIDALP